MVIRQREPGRERERLSERVQAYCAYLAAGRGGRSTVLAYSPELEAGGPASGLDGLGEIEPVDSSIP